MNRITDEELINLRNEFKEGTIVELVEMDDVDAPPTGTKGIVEHVDSIGTIHISWDNGSGLGAVYGVDKVRKV